MSGAPGNGRDGSTEGGGADFLRGLITGAIVAVLLLVTIAPLRDLLPAGSGDDRIEEAMEVIESTYFEDVDEVQLEDGSINGMVNQLRKEYDDRFSHFFDAETYEKFDAATSGEFSGVGMTVSEVPKGLRVARVFEDTPAADGGLAVGDLIVAVDGEDISGVSSSEAAALIKGEPGTEVELSVVDAKSGKKSDLELERARVQVPAVDGEIIEQNGEEIGYAQLAGFTRGAHGELRALVEELERDGADGIVLDLRGNGGGLLNEAILVASIFQEDGPVVITEGRTRPRQVYEAEGDALPEKPMVILVNGDTASSSEIVTASLQQNDIATVVGERTFGKGTFQEVVELDGGGALDLTVGEYLTSDGTSINGKGIKPDVRVPDDGDPANGDEALEEALDIVAAEIAAGSTDQG